MYLPCCAEDVRQQREKETKNDTTIELAALLHEVRSLGSKHSGSFFC
jgi:hypothetical protein